jgi:TRAP-type C4-dicarboxylate transport system permease small subunit
MRRTPLLFACLGIVGLIAASFLTLADVSLRYMGAPIDAMSEIVGLLVTLSIALFFPLTLWDDHNLTISYLGDMLGGAWLRWLRVLGAIATLFFFALICWRLVLYAIDTYESGETTPMAGIEIFSVWWLVGLSFALAVVIQVYLLARCTGAAVTGRTGRGGGTTPNAQS